MESSYCFTFIHIICFYNCFLFCLKITSLCHTTLIYFNGLLYFIFLYLKFLYTSKCDANVFILFYFIFCFEESKKFYCGFAYAFFFKFYIIISYKHLQQFNYIYLFIMFFSTYTVKN